MGVRRELRNDGEVVDVRECALVQNLVTLFLGLIGCVKTSVFLSAVGWCVFRGALGRWEVGWFVI